MFQPRNSTQVKYVVFIGGPTLERYRPLKCGTELTRRSGQNAQDFEKPTRISLTNLRGLRRLIFVDALYRFLVYKCTLD